MLFSLANVMFYRFKRYIFFFSINLFSCLCFFKCVTHDVRVRSDFFAVCVASLLVRLNITRISYVHILISKNVNELTFLYDSIYIYIYYSIVFFCRATATKKKTNRSQCKKMLFRHFHFVRMCACAKYKYTHWRVATQSTEQSHSVWWRRLLLLLLFR